jgi:copper chaperone
MTTIRIQGMKCQHCAASAQKVLEDLGATNVQIDLARGEASFEGHFDPEAVKKAIAAKGYEVID